MTLTMAECLISEIRRPVSGGRISGNDWGLITDRNLSVVGSPMASLAGNGVGQARKCGNKSYHYRHNTANYCQLEGLNETPYNFSIHHPIEERRNLYGSVYPPQRFLSSRKIYRGIYGGRESRYRNHAGRRSLPQQFA